MAETVDLTSDGPDDDSVDEVQIVGIARPLAKTKELPQVTSEDEKDDEESEEDAWESESLYADALDGMPDNHNTELCKRRSLSTE